MRRIGVAVGQTVSCTAEPLTILPARDGMPQWDAVAALIETWRPDVLIVGDPLNMDGTTSDMCLLARKFARRLEGRFGINTVMVDERLSSFEAKAGQRDAAAVDDEAARLILQTWLDAESRRRN